MIRPRLFRLLSFWLGLPGLLFLVYLPAWGWLILRRWKAAGKMEAG